MRRAVAALAALFAVGCQAPASHAPAAIKGEIEVSAPVPDAAIETPLVVDGRAVGPWFFEASFNAKLVAEDGTVLAEAPATAQGEWTTTDFVPFRATLNFDAGAHTAATLLLEKSNMGEDHAQDETLKIPLKLKH